MAHASQSRVFASKIFCIAKNGLGEVTDLSNALERRSLATHTSIGLISHKSWRKETWIYPLHTMGVTVTPIVADDTSSSPPPRKRLRQDPVSVASNFTKAEPRLFVPFRALGLITNHIPFVLQTRSHKGATDGPRIHLLTCLGKAWAMWEGGKMGLLFVGE